MSRMVDFNKMPITQWPSVESYDAFKRYFTASIHLMETSVDVDKSITVEQRRKEYDGTLNNLQKNAQCRKEVASLHIVYLLLLNPITNQSKNQVHEGEVNVRG
jgi:hypothetical protein